MGRKGKKVGENGGLTVNVDDEDAALFREQLDIHKRKGDELFAQAQLGDALTAYERALSFSPCKSPERALLHSNRAACFIRERRLPEAHRECNLALEAQENYGRALVRRARVFELASRADEALADLELAAKAGQLSEEGGKALQRLRLQKAEAPPKITGLGKSGHLDQRRSRSSRAAAAAAAAAQPQAPARRAPQAAHLVLMCRLGKESGRVAVPVSVTYHELLQACVDAFPQAGALALKYKDSEGDMVTITSRVDLRNAVQDALRRTSADPEAQRRQASGLLPELAITLVPVARSPECPPEEAAAGGGGAAADEVVEIDEWLLDFADRFKARLELKEGETVDMRAIGLDKCCEVLEAVVGAPDAASLLEAAAAKFQEAAAAALYNWGNVHVCTARKTVDVAQAELVADSLRKAQAAEPDCPLPLIDDSVAQEQAALSNWDALEAEHARAVGRWQESLRVKADFHEAALAWGQQAFERAKLLVARSAAYPAKCKPAEADAAFALACQKFEEATAMVEASEAAAKGKAAAKGEKVVAVAAEAEANAEAGLTPLQHLAICWGNVLFERSNVKFRRSDSSWRADADAAVAKFRGAKCPEADIAKALQGHASGAWKEGGKEAAKEASRKK